MQKSKNPKFRHIVVDENTYQDLKRLGQTAESFNTVIRRLLEKKAEKRKGKSVFPVISSGSVGEQRDDQ